jgi:hypothetical protein
MAGAFAFYDGNSALRAEMLSGIRAERITQRGRTEVHRPDPDAHYASFLITDGDNLQWMLGDFPTDARWFGSPHRGKVGEGQIRRGSVRSSTSTRSRTRR